MPVSIIPVIKPAIRPMKRNKILSLDDDDWKSFMSGVPVLLLGTVILDDTLTLDDSGIVVVLIKVGEPIRIGV